MSEIFGVSTDYLLKDDMEYDGGKEPLGDSEEYYETKVINMEEASSFLDHKFSAAGRIAIGVMMCIFSPILMMVLGGAAEAGKIALS